MKKLEKLFKKHRDQIRLLVMAIIGVLVGAWILTFFYNYSQRSRADQDAVSVSFENTNITTGVNASGELKIIVTTPQNEPISIGTLLIQFPHNLVSINPEDPITDTCNTLSLTDARIINDNVLALTMNKQSARANLPSGAFCFASIKYQTQSTEGEGMFTILEESAGGFSNEFAGPDAENGYAVQVENGTANITVQASTPVLYNRVLHMNGLTLFEDGAKFRYQHPGINLDAGDYTLSADAFVYNAQGQGLTVAIVCDETDGCPGGTAYEVAYTPSLVWNAVTTEKLAKITTVTIPADGTYSVWVLADKGTEADIDNVSLKRGSEELLNNGGFSEVQSPRPAIMKMEPNGWTAGTDNWGYQFGKVSPNYQNRSVLFINSTSRVPDAVTRYEKTLQVTEATTVRLSATVQTLLSKGRGVSIGITCSQLQGCPGDKEPGDVYDSISFPASGQFGTQNKDIALPGPGTYAVTIVVNDGSEALIDNISVTADQATLLSEEFTGENSTQVNIQDRGIINWNEAVGWGAGTNNWGYEYAVVVEDLHGEEGGSTPTGVPTGGSGTGNVNINFRIKLQGITSVPKVRQPMNVKVTFKNNDSIVATDMVRFENVQNDGTWTTSHRFNLDVNKKYTVLLKGPKHLQKRVCENNPDENVAGTYHCTQDGIVVQNGNMTLDFSNIILLAGDLPTQDGIIDSRDIAYIRNNLGNSSEEVVARADLNFDGIIDSQDYGLIIHALSFKYDEGR